MELPDYIVYTYQRIADVHLHLAGSVLSEREQLYLEQVKHAGRRTAFTAGRIVARQFAGAVLNLDPVAVPLKVADDGSLILPDTSASISLAHSHEGVCVALSSAAVVGIDLETIKPRHPDLHRFILHPDEYEMLDLLPLTRDETLILCWSLKEATLKGMKTGFRYSPKKLKLSVDLDRHQADVLIEGASLWQAHFEKRDGCYLSIAHPKP